MPIEGQTNPEPRTKEAWRFHVRGEVERELLLTWDDFMRLPQVEQVSDIHCVTSWSMFDLRWTGVQVAELLRLAGLKPTAAFVIFEAEQGYTTNVPLAEARQPNVLIAHKLFGKDLPKEHGGPARGVVPDLYFYKSAKWVTGIRILDHDEPGYWENLGYHNHADPWQEERLS
jgi:DMSO/TMAO reductase YedYZ molybdopterin-dependent catalytic subunit